MDEVAQLIIGIFLLSGAVLAWIGWKGGRWLKILAAIMASLWVYEAQWYGRALINVRWIDDERTKYQHDVLLRVIQAGKSRIPLAETTDFRWTVVCQVWAEPPYSPAWDKETMQKVFGTDRIDYFDNGGGGEYEVLVYATPDGPYVMEPRSSRFGREFQGRLMGRYYQERLGGKGYWVEVKTYKRKNGDLGSLCFRPEDIWLEISPEPDWTDNIPALVEQMMKQTKSP